MSGINPEKSIFRELQNVYKKMEQMESRYKTEIRHLHNKIDDLEKRNAKLQRKVIKLENENERLKRALNNTSSNSSLPPSTDQKPSKSPNEYNSRKKTNLKAGGQKGHYGTTLTLAEIEAKVKQGIFQREVHVSQNLSLKDRLTRHYVKRYVIDLRIIPIVHEYHLAAKEASSMAPVSYGNNIKALAVDLITEHSVSLERTVSFLNTLAGNSISLAHGTVDGFLTRFSLQSEATITNISTQLLNSPIVHTDATNINLNGIQSYIRNQSTEQNVLYSSQDKKNLLALKATGILKAFAGLFVIDHETGMYNFGTKHAECNAHLIRYLTKTKEEANNSWATEMIAFLTSMNEYRQERKRAGDTGFNLEALERYSKRYDEIVRQGHQQNQSTKRRFAKREEKALLRRLENYKDSYLCFMYNFDVAFTNNMSERDLRKCKNKQKISGGFRSKSGKERYCNIMSIIETCKRRDMNTLDGIRRILAGEVLFG